MNLDLTTVYVVETDDDQYLGTLDIHDGVLRVLSGFGHRPHHVDLASLVSIRRAEDTPVQAEGIPFHSLRIAIEEEVRGYADCGKVARDLFDTSVHLIADRWARTIDEGDDELYDVARQYAEASARALADAGVDIRIEGLT